MFFPLLLKHPYQTNNQQVRPCWIIIYPLNNLVIRDMEKCLLGGNTKMVFWTQIQFVRYLLAPSYCLMNLVMGKNKTKQNKQNKTVVIVRVNRKRNLKIPTPRVVISRNCLNIKRSISGFCSWTSVIFCLCLSSFFPLGFISVLRKEYHGAKSSELRRFIALALQLLLQAFRSPANR